MLDDEKIGQTVLELVLEALPEEDWSIGKKLFLREHCCMEMGIFWLVEDVAELFKKPVQTIKNLIETEDIDILKWGKQIYIDISGIMEIKFRMEEIGVLHEPS